MKKLLLLALICVSCSSRRISYNHQKITTKYINYSVFLDDKKIELKNYFLDKRNIKNVILDRTLKKLYINQKEYRKLASLKDFKPKADSYLIVIDGIPLDNSNFKIDPKIIKSVTFLSDSIKIGCRNDVNPLIITTKR